MLLRRLYILKTMTFDFHQVAYLERMKKFYFVEWVLGKLLTPGVGIFAVCCVAAVLLSRETGFLRMCAHQGRGH